MPGRTMTLAAVICGVAVVALAGIAWSVRSTGAAGGEQDSNPTLTDAEMAEIVRDMRIAPFAGVDHRGEPVDASMFSDHWTVVSFGFTYCTVTCPMMHAEIHRMAEKLADRGVRFVTFSVDPAHDTASQMGDHVDRWAMKNDSWTFVRTDEATIGALLKGLLMGRLAVDPANIISLPGGSTMSNIHHPSRFFVVGPDGAVRGLWHGTNPSDVDALIRWMLTNAR